MANYLVTGGAGFIGSNIVESLVREEAYIRVVDNLSTGKRENLAPFLDRIDLIVGDLCDPDICTRAVRDMDYVLHQAAVPSVPRSVSDPLLNHRANVTATVNLLIAARDARVKRFVFASSSSVYGDQPQEIKTEDLLLSLLSPYAAAKASCEHYLQAFSTCYGMETVCLRYFNVFGPRQDPNSPYSAVIPLFITAIMQGRSPIVHGDGLQARDFTFVENNVRANILAATADFEAKGQPYNIACGESYNLLQLLDEINKTFGTHIKPEHTPPRVGDIRISKAEIARAQRDFGYKVTVPFEKGLARTIEWYRGVSAR